jgi:diguanylate cyclase (GGDEF)-like protein/PAS domain S-box-containing protein
VPFFFDCAKLDPEPVTLGEICGANKAPPPTFWDRLAPRALPNLALCPWGDIVEAHVIAPGIVWFKTATRSGYCLSPTRQRALPRDFRTDDGWYEDTTEWAAVAVVFYQIFARMPVRAGNHDLSLYQAGKETLKHWHPEKYESWFQTTFDLHEIENLAIMRFHRIHADRLVAIEVARNRRSYIYGGPLVVAARRGGDPPYGAKVEAIASPVRRFLVSVEEFQRQRGRPFLIDPLRHFEIDGPEQGAALWTPAAEQKPDGLSASLYAESPDETVRPPLADAVFSQIAETANDIIIVTTADLNPPGPQVVYVNAAFTRLTGYSADEAIGQSPRILRGPGTSRTTLDLIDATLRDVLPVHEKVLNYAKSGAPYRLDMRIVPLRDGKGAITHFAAIAGDVTMDNRRLDEVEVLADRDTLTGIRNRQSFTNVLKTEIERAQPYRSAAVDGALCVAFIDVDRFKKVNDEKGRAVGDAVLCGLADRLSEIVRRSDTLARIGGEEFAVCMPRISLRDAKGIAERLRRAVAAEPFETQSGPLSVTVSIGVAAFKQGETAESLMQRAVTGCLRRSTAAATE